VSIDYDALAERWGTPLYVYDLAAVRRAVDGLRDDLPSGATLLYSVKANPHPSVVAELVRSGLGLEVSSSGELAGAVAASDQATGLRTPLVFTGPGKTDLDIGSALDLGVRLFSVESVAERDRLARLAQQRGVDAEYLVRLNHPASNGAGSLRMTGRSTPFGVDTDDTVALRDALRPVRAASPIGLHTYFATNVADADLLAEELVGAVASAATVCEATGHQPKILDVGGGFGAPMARPGALSRHPRLAAALDAAVAQYWPETGTRPRLVFEAGRHLVGTAGTLLTRVVDLKATRARRFAVLDAGVHTVGGMSGLGRLHAPRTVPRGWHETTREPAAVMGEYPVALVGPLCTPLDVLHPEVCPPYELEVGTLLAVPNIGAYGLSASLLGFLGHPVAAEVVVDGEEVVDARRLVLAAEDLRPALDGGAL
jgi:diaminopimelate decarboxylase